MRILLTGGSGFIGSKILTTLESNNHVVINYDLKTNLNILDNKKLEQFIKKVDLVMHVAAQANFLEMESLQGAKTGVDFNVQGTHNICYFCTKHKKKLIYASTVCVYGNIQEEATEEGAVNPSELYAFSKLAGEQLVKGYSLNFGLEYIILRFATTYGPGMRSELGTSIFITQAIANKDITVHGDGKQTRTLTHVNDVAQGCLQAVNNFNIAKNNIFNISHCDSISALKMAKDIKKQLKSSSKIKFISQRKNQTFKEKISNKKAQTFLKWTPKIPWEEGIRDIVNLKKVEFFKK